MISQITAFTTARLDYRLLNDVGEALFCTLYTDAETMRFVGPPLSPQRAARAFRRAVQISHRPQSDRQFFAMLDRQTAQPVGIGSLQQIDLVQRRAEAGIMITTPCRALGYGREALSGLISHAFERYALDETWLQIAVVHTVVEKLVIGVGLHRGAEVAADADHFATRIWSIRRDAWRITTQSTDYSPCGESNVERHRVIGTTRP
jgi:RimJ/RimL family protein N-acetyltransferase